MPLSFQCLSVIFQLEGLRLVQYLSATLNIHLPSPLYFVLTRLSRSSAWVCHYSLQDFVLTYMHKLLLMFSVLAHHRVCCNTPLVNDGIYI